MFERIKCYRRFRRAEKILRGFANTGLLDEKTMNGVNEALKTSASMKKGVLFDRQKAKDCNLEFEKNGFK